MNPAIYLSNIQDNLQIFIWILVFLIPLHIFLLRSIAVNIYDPIAMVILADLFCSALVIFMWRMDDISHARLIYYVLTQLAFYGGLLIYNFSTVRQINRLPIQINFTAVQNIFFASALLNIAVVSLKWGMTGIPLFKISRLGAFVDSGGLGIIERLENGSYMILAFSTLCLLLNFKNKMPLVIFFAIGWLLVYDMLSGSKAALLGLIQIYFFLRYIFSKKDSGDFFCGRLGAMLFVLATIFAVLVLFVEKNGNFQAALTGFIIRVVSFGDVYIYAYIYNSMAYLQGENPFIGLFGGVLSTFRIISNDLAYQNMGLQLSQIIFPGLDYIAGPNPRHPIFGYHYFGWGGILFSAILGLIIKYFQIKLYEGGQKTYITLLLPFLIYFTVVNLGGDFDYTLSTLASMGISFLTIALISRCLVVIHSKKSEGV